MSVTIDTMQQASRGWRAFLRRNQPRKIKPRSRFLPASLYTGSHGPTHHPHFMHAWKKMCTTVMPPLLRLSDRLNLRYLRNSQFQEWKVPSRLGSIHVVSAVGKGPLPPVVVLHGLSASTTDYALLLHRFSHAFKRVIAIDLPGHGTSPDFSQIDEATFCGAIGDALNQLITTPVLLFGHSLGGYIAARYAAANPDKVAGLALAAPPGAPASQKMRRDVVRMFAQESYHDTFASAVRAFPRGPIAWLPLMAASHARLARRSLQVLIHSDISQCLLTPEVLHSLKSPVLLLWGDKERLIPVDQHAYFRTHMPSGTRVVIVPHMGHSEMAMAPRRILDPIVDFASNLPSVPRVRRTRFVNISAPRIAVRS